MNTYPQGSVVRSRVTFRDGITKQAVDPSVVTFAFKVGDNAPVAPITFTGSPDPASGVIGRLGVGRYETWVDSENFAGEVMPLWDSSGEGQAEGWRPFTITPRPF